MLIKRPAMNSGYYGVNATYTVSITQTDPHRHKFTDAITEYVYDDMDSWADNSSGDAESPVGWFGRVGSKRIIRGDERGFVWLEKFGNEYERDLVLDALESVYGAWEGFDTDNGEADELELERRSNYLSYVYRCEADATTPHEYDTWLVR